MLSEPRAIVLVEVYLSGLPCADSLLALTLRGESIGVEVVLDRLVPHIFAFVVLFLKSELSGQCERLRTDAKLVCTGICCPNIFRVFRMPNSE